MIESKRWLHEPEYDLSRFYQRLRYGNDVANPLRFFTAPFALASAKRTLERYKDQEIHSNGQLMVTPQQLQEYRQAQKVVASVIHPDTGQPISLLGRMSGFVVVNLPLSFMLLMTPPTTFNILFSQWLNQTYNSYMNYSNRNGTSLYTNQDVMIGYVSAVLVAGSLSLGGQRLFRPWIQRFRSEGSQRVARTVFTIIAVASAGFANLVMMRRKEMDVGISVFSPSTGQEIGKSKVAAKKAVLQTGMSRPLLCSTMFIPSGGCYLIEKLNLMPRRRVPQLMVEVGLCGVGLYLGLLMAISCFPQQGTLARADLEPEIVEKMKEDQHVLYNKGL